jgi:hypothetical protein
MYSAIRHIQFLFAARERSYRSQVQQPLIGIGILECHHRRRLVEPPILYLDGAIAGVYRKRPCLTIRHHRRIACCDKSNRHSFA